MGDLIHNNKTIVKKYFTEMKKIDLGLDFIAIREQIELDKKNYSSTVWAKETRMSKSSISNIHGKKRAVPPSLDYIVAVAAFTKKPIEWYLYGRNNSPDFMCDWPEEHKKACKLLKEILDSSDDDTIDAIHSNLKAFRKSVKKDAIIKKLVNDVEELRRGMSSGRPTGIGVVASSNTGKPET